MFFFFLLCTMVYGQQEERIYEGMVIGEGGQPLEFATVSLLAADSTFIVGCITDNAGRYKLATTGKPELLKVTCIGYKDAYSRDGKNVRMEADQVELKEVVVRSHRNPVKISGSKIEVNVAGTMLAREMKVATMLRKIPGLTGDGSGGIKTLDGYTPEIYLNERKVTDVAELLSLDVKDIKTITLDTSPGARYGGNVKAVVNITTNRKGKGVSVLYDTYAQWNHRFSHENRVDVNYNTEHVDYFVGLSYSDYRRKSYQDIDVLIDKSSGEQVEISEILNGDRISDRKLQYYAGFNAATLNGGLTFGLKYVGTYFYSNSKTSFDASNSGMLMNGANHTRDTDMRNHVNLYLKYRPAEHWIATVYADYYGTNYHRRQLTEEQDDQMKERLTTLRSHSRYAVCSVNPIITYSKNRTKIEFGGEIIRVDGINRYDYEGMDACSYYDTDEHTYAAFANYTLKQKKGCLQAGARYEYVANCLDNKYDDGLDLSRNYSNVIGDISYSLKTGAISQSLALRTTVDRPSFGVLNNYTYYMNAYSFQEGNPKLKPSTTYQLKYDFGYAFAYLSVKYNYIKNHIGTYLYCSPAYPDAFIASWQNYDNLQRLMVTLNLHKTFGWYEGSLTLAYIRSKLDTGDYESHLKITPQVTVNFNNQITLPANANLNIEYLYKSKGSMGMFTFKPTHVLNINLTKSFLKNKIELGIYAEDVLNQNIARYSGNINNINMWQYEDQDRRNIGIELTWRFNSYKNTYKGKTSGQKVINRL